MRAEVADVARPCTPTTSAPMRAEVADVARPCTPTTSAPMSAEVADGARPCTAQPGSMPPVTPLGPMGDEPMPFSTSSVGHRGGVDGGPSQVAAVEPLVRHLVQDEVERLRRLADG